jgi:hypothetical protein
LSDSELADWIKKELVANKTELSTYKDQVKQFLRLTPEGGVLIENRGLTARHQVGLYYVGAAYAKIAGFRESDEVSNKEIVEKLGMPDGTLHPKVKELRDNHFIIPTKAGHRINYSKIGTLFDEIGKKKDEK